MSGAESGVLRAAASWLVGAGLSIGLVIALGWLPWRRLGGESGSSALLVGAAVAFLGALCGALPVLRAVGSPDSSSPGPAVAGWSTGLRSGGTAVLALVAVTGTDLARQPLLIAVGVGYAVLLVVETKWMLRWLRVSGLQAGSK